MRAAVTGATGFIGRHLLGRLEAPAVLTRDPRRVPGVFPGARAFAWNPLVEPAPVAAFEGVDAVFHLAGEPIADRWTDEKKRRIYDSRILGTRNLAAGLKALPSPPKVLVSASAVGYYGGRGDEKLDETSPPGDGFLAGVCQEWEAEALRAREAGIRVVVVRIGVVLGRGGGALAEMLPVFKLGIGGRLGSGRQWMSWIHIEDLTALFLHAAATEGISGAMNAAAPEPVTNRQFTRELARALHRPALFAVPAFVLRLAFGEMSQVLLGSQRVLPRVAQQAGFEYRYPRLPEALRAIF